MLALAPLLDTLNENLRGLPLLALSAVGAGGVALSIYASQERNLPLAVTGGVVAVGIVGGVAITAGDNGSDRSAERTAATTTTSATATAASTITIPPATASTSTSTTANPNAVRFRSNDAPASGGYFQYALLGFECGVERAPGRITDVTANTGTLCVARLNARNPTDTALDVLPEAILFVGDDRYPLAFTSSKFTPDRVFPRSAAQGTMAFEIPVGSQPTQLTVYDQSDDVKATFRLFIAP